MAAPTSYTDISAHGHREKQAEFRKADEDAHYRLADERWFRKN
jgi:hypothetical protein